MARSFQCSSPFPPGSVGEKAGYTLGLTIIYLCSGIHAVKAVNEAAQRFKFACKIKELMGSSVEYPRRSISGVRRQNDLLFSGSRQKSGTFRLQAPY